MKERRFWQGQKIEKRLKRELFFEEITQSAYHVNESLRTEVYIPYQSVIPGYYTPRFEELDELAEKHFDRLQRSSNHPDYGYLDRWNAYMMADDSRYPELIPVREAVITWSRKNHLDVDWCREVAVRTLDYWVREDLKTKDEADEEQKLYDWSCPSGGKVNVHPLEHKLVPLPDFPRYFPFIHRSLDRYLQEVKLWMKEKIIPESVWHQLKSSWIGSDSTMGPRLDKYIEEDFSRICEIAEFYALSLEAYYRDKGHKHVRTQPEEGKHIKWAVQAQMYEETTFSSIAKSENLFNNGRPNASYVRREVLKVLEEIELPLRPGLLKPGRRKGAIEKKPRHRVSSG
jgi:hypothetical protein